MKKYFYRLGYAYTNPENNENYLLIGYFSTIQTVQQAIQKVKDKVGFVDSGGNFEVEKFSVNFDNEIKSKQEVKLFELSHEYTDDEGYDNWIIFDVFSSYEEAKKSELEETKKSPYNKNPEGFCISECKIDVCGWSEGFVLWD